MNKYEYNTKMKGYAIRMANVLLAKKDFVISKFYQAAANEFQFKLESMTIEEANSEINEEESRVVTEYESKVKARERELKV